MKPLVLAKALLAGAGNTAWPVLDMREHLEMALGWLCAAQDAWQDGGVALRYSLNDGWSPSYPETTGYIIPTLLECERLVGERGLRERALRMADFEVAVQNADGSTNGGAIGSSYGGFVFDTGQVIFGFIAAHRITREQRYLDAALHAGAWLLSVQDANGRWSRHTFEGIEHVYYARVAWALAELGVYAGEPRFQQAARRNVSWVLEHQQPNGWFERAGFTMGGHAAPYTHTIAYTVEGVLETGVALGEAAFIDAACRSLDAIAGIVGPDGCLSGQLDRNWTATGQYACLTGSAQFALHSARGYLLRGGEARLRTAQRLLRYVAARQLRFGGVGVTGAIGGSWPIWGRYQRFAFPNWAAKFFIDAILAVRVAEGGATATTGLVDAEVFRG
jgi:hypothetical protein